MNPEILQEDEQRAQRHQDASERILTRVRQEKNDLLDANTQLGIELKDVRAQLADSVKENKRLRGTIFSTYPNLPLHNLAREGTDRVMSIGMLTGHPEEDMPGSSGGLL